MRSKINEKKKMTITFFFPEIEYLFRLENPITERINSGIGKMKIRNEAK